MFCTPIFAVEYAFDGDETVQLSAHRQVTVSKSMVNGQGLPVTQIPPSEQGFIVNAPNSITGWRLGQIVHTVKMNRRCHDWSC